MPGYSGFPGHHLHQLAGGAGSLLELAVPFLVLAILVVLMAAVQWAGRRIEDFRNRPIPPAGVSGAVARHSAAVQPVLASDLEREQIARLVSHAIGEGRLSFEEGDERIDAVLRSHHRHELERLVADLPAGFPDPSPPVPGSPLRRRVLAVAAALVLAAVGVQALVGLWVLWPVAVASLGIASILPRR